MPTQSPPPASVPDAVTPLQDPAVTPLPPDADDDADETAYQRPQIALEAPEGTGLYARLSQPFDVEFHDTRSGTEITYVTGEQVTSRLNEVLGFQHWSFRVVQQDLHVEADEMWVLGELTADVDGKVVIRQQFGSQKIKRGRTSGAPLDIGFDLKGAATDALKKCASLIGVGLYLSQKKGTPATPVTTTPSLSRPAAPAAGRAAPTPIRPAAAAGRSDCEDCGAELTETRFKDGTVWSAADLAGYGRRKHGRVLCMEHYRAANEARRATVRS